MKEIIAFLENMGFSKTRSGERDSVGVWELNQGMRLLRIMLDCEDNISIFQFGQKMILEYQLKDIDICSVPKNVIFAIINASVAH